MPTYNYKARELIAKVVYYGPGRCGKTTNLQQIHARMRPETRSELLSVATETDRTIYFDLLPLNLGTISGMKFMVRLFTVPGQVYYSETRKLVLRGADGIVFVADSQDHMMDENRESLRDLKVNLQANGLDYSNIPLVLQYNKRDLPRLIPEAELNATLNDRAVKAINSVAMNGTGVLETLRYVTVSVFNHIKSGGKISTPVETGPPTPERKVVVPVPAPLEPTAVPPPPRPVTAGTPTRRSAKDALEAARQVADAAERAAAQHAARAPRPAASKQETVALENIHRAESNPAIVGTEFIIEEFKMLALMTSQLTERVAILEQEVKRLGRENEALREHLAHSPDGT